MEILRFEDQGPKAPNRKKSSRGLLVVGLIATLFGISSAFASSTITINTDNKVNLGQGVVTVSGCDSTIGFKPETVLNDSATAFRVTGFLIGYEFDTSTSGLIDNVACAGKQLKVRLYKDVLGVPTTVACASTYNSSADTGTNLKRDSKLLIGTSSTDIDNLASYDTAYKCSSDGAFYFNVTSLGDTRDRGFRMYWPKQASYFFDANSFDHITIESVDGETGLSH
jgi:hypothetical protein